MFCAQVFSIAAALVNDNIELGADVCEQLPESCEVRVARQRGKTVLLGNLPALLQAEALLKVGHGSIGYDSSHEWADDLLNSSIVYMMYALI